MKLVDTNETSAKYSVDIPENGNLGNIVSNSYFYMYAVIFFMLFIVTITKCVSLFLWCIKVSTNMHNNMLKKILRTPMKFFHDNPPGRIVNRFIKDLGIMDETIPSILMDNLNVSETLQLYSFINSVLAAGFKYYSRFLYNRK